MALQKVNRNLLNTGVSDSSDATAITIDSSERVGINQTSPAAKLDIKGDTTTYDGMAKIYLTDTSSNSGSRNWSIGNGGSAFGSFTIGCSNAKNGDPQDASGTHFNPLVITNAGNVGIGTNSPNAYSNVTTLTINGTNQGRVDLEFGGTLSGSFLALSGQTQIKASGGSQVMVFEVNDAERMRIDTSGNLLVGTTNSNTLNDGFRVLPAGSSGGTLVECFNDSSGTALLVGRGGSDGVSVDFRRGSGQVGTISVTTSATSYNTSSDARLKDVTGSARGLEVINKLNPVSYNWKADGKADEGLIAQEVMEIVPNAVSGSEEDMYQMDYSKLVTPLIKAIQELAERVKNLEG